MKTPPQMISPKDCLTFSDLLETSLTFSKKAKEYYDQIEDQAIQKMAERHIQFYNELYQSILTLLEEGQ